MALGGTLFSACVALLAAGAGVFGRLDGRTQQRPHGGEMINIVPPLDPVNSETLAPALESYVNVTAHVHAVNRWQHYRRAYRRVAQHIDQHRLAPRASPNAAPPAAVAEIAEEAEQDLLRFTSPDSIAGHIATVEQRLLYSLLAEVLLLKDTPHSKRLAARCRAAERRLALSKTTAITHAKRERQKDTYREGGDVGGGGRGGGDEDSARDWEFLSVWRHSPPPPPAFFTQRHSASPPLPVSGPVTVTASSWGRLLVCQPTFGLGNRINAVMMCQALALATRRRMVLHWNCIYCHDQVTRARVRARARSLSLTYTHTHTHTHTGSLPPLAL